ncbi:MAG: histidinol-phosphate transaminase [Bacteroidaceae bacterium]|nr:histidinol-phosphate transaminase [Bacteroidaceae bacterium]
MIESLVRKNIQQLKPYSSARDEYKGKTASVFLDANENPYGSPLNRYPDPLQEELKRKIAEVKQVPAENIFLGNGSDEAIDLVFRVFCEPRIDNVVAIDPTYGMYEVCANINDVEYRKVALDEHFQIKAEQLLKACDQHTKLIFLCSPNNPTGNDICREEIVKVIEQFRGIVIVDEAYSDFSEQRPFRLDLGKYENLIVYNTFSKAYGHAAIRLGMAFASTEIIALFNKVKYPYNVNELTQQKAKELLAEGMSKICQRINLILDERTTVMQAFAQLPLCEQVYPSNANFFLAKVSDANRIYNYLVDKGIIVRNRNSVHLCGNCLRVTIGTKEENTQLLSALRVYKP